jgi:DNA-binding NtrC family response regulator
MTSSAGAPKPFPESQHPGKDDRPRARILVVDDDRDVLRLLSYRLEQLGFHVDESADGAEALKRIQTESVDLMLLDLRLPTTSGVEVLKQVKQTSPDTIVVVMTAYASVEKAVEAMREGAFDFLTKPLTPGHLEVVVQKAFERQALLRSQRLLHEESDWKIQPILGEAPAIRRAIELGQRAARSSSTVLLLGESGTGKEVFARAIHAWSPRRSQPCVVINCATLSEELVASELFGHERGAFTGAHIRRQGKLELAAGGTVFLDEIGEIPPALQAKLLRVLQDHCFERVGGTQTIHTDIRVIAATNRNLAKSVRDGTFREDLFFRLNVIPMTLPPLRERKDDIPRLAEMFITRHCRDLKKPPMRLSTDARAALEEYDWPGNVRELGNVLERAVVLNDGDEIASADLALPVRYPPLEEASDVYRSRIETAEKAALLEALAQYNGDKSAAAQAMGISRSTLYAKLKKHRL